MNFIYFEQASKINSFGAFVVIKTLFLRFSVTVKPHRSLLTVRYHELLDIGSFLSNQFRL